MNSTSIVLSNEELSEISDLIVFGKVTGQRAAPKSIVEEFADPKRKGETVEATFIHHMVLLSFQVDEYFKGTGPKEITIATFDKHPVHLKIEQSQLYILYLNQPRTKEDQEFFENAYYIGTVDQGVWEVRGDLAVQQFDGGKFARLADLRDGALPERNRIVATVKDYMRRVHVFGKEVTLSSDELTAISDAIVRGAPVGEATAKKNPEYPPGYSEYHKVQDAELLKGAKVFSFNVEEYYKGEGLAVINIFTDGSKGYPFLDESASQILYLHEIDDEIARAYYDKAYVIVAAGQGIWKVNDGKAVQQFGDGESVELSDLRN